ECYTMALEDTPGLAGRVMTEFVISGEPEVGGLVEESTISDDGTTIAHPGMRECMRETLYSIEFEPPPDGGRVMVRYPFEVRPDVEQEPGEAETIDRRGLGERRRRRDATKSRFSSTAAASVPVALLWQQPPMSEPGRARMRSHSIQSE